MYNCLSRNEKRQLRLRYKAERGFFTSDEVLYNSEARKLLKEGFDLLKVSGGDVRRGLSLYVVSWEHAYDKHEPSQKTAESVIREHDCLIDAVKTYAQSLYDIALKASQKL